MSPTVVIRYVCPEWWSSQASFVHWRASRVYGATSWNWAGSTPGRVTERPHVGGDEEVERLDLVGVRLPGVGASKAPEQVGRAQGHPADRRLIEPGRLGDRQPERLADEALPDLRIQPRSARTGLDRVEEVPEAVLGPLHEHRLAGVVERVNSA